jgi:alpha-beta hydrolase superfamily lysophospholipase
MEECMKSTTLTFKAADGAAIFVYKWFPESGKPRACVQITHGLAEHAARYAGLAERLTAEGFACYANDLRGHGKTAGVESKRGVFGPGGWDSLVTDMKELNEIIAKDNPGAPVFLLGHSLGSYLGQDYAERFASSIKGIAHSGPRGAQTFVVNAFGAMLARLVILFRGSDTPSALSYNLTFKDYNKQFLPSATGTDFDWLSRDPEVIRKYASDPWCGFKISGGASLELVKGLKRTWRPENERKIPHDLPMLFQSGTRDSTNRCLKDLKPLVERYRAYGIEDITVKYYPDARHEIFNETNREEVIADLVAWIEAHL